MRMTQLIANKPALVQAAVGWLLVGCLVPARVSTAPFTAPSTTPCYCAPLLCLIIVLKGLVLLVIIIHVLLIS